MSQMSSTASVGSMSSINTKCPGAPIKRPRVDIMLLCIRSRHESGGPEFVYKYRCIGDLSDDDVLFLDDGWEMIEGRETGRRKGIAKDDAFVNSDEWAVIDHPRSLPSYFRVVHRLYARLSHPSTFEILQS